LFIFIFWRARESKREVELEKRQHLKRWARIPRQQASTSFKAEYNIECNPYGMDFWRPYNHLLCTKIEGDRKNISKKFGTHPKASIQSFIGIEIEAPAVINFWVKFCTIRTNFWHDFRGFYNTFFEKKGHSFRGFVPVEYFVQS
jgi:hypothetical protein